MRQSRCFNVITGNGKCGERLIYNLRTLDQCKSFATLFLTPEPLYAMRNRIAHGYFKADFELVWKTIHEDLPERHQQVRRLIEP